MSITKITADVNNISALSDNPNVDDNLTAAELKAKFDKAGSDIKTGVNLIVDELESTTDESSGASQIGASALYVGDESDSNVQAKLEELQSESEELKAGGLTDGSIATAKLADGAVTSDKLDTDAKKAANLTATSIGTGDSYDGNIQAKLVGLKSEVDTKVDKVEGKELSTNDYDNTEKASVASNTSARHTHDNKTLLDTYTQTEEDIADAISKEHEHSNKTVLDNTTASYTTTEATKLSGIDENANNYSLPTASTSTLGGVKIDGVTVLIEDGVISSVGGGSGADLIDRYNTPTLTQETIGEETVNILSLANELDAYFNNQRVLIDIPSSFDNTKTTYLNINSLGNKLINFSDVLHSDDIYELVYNGTSFDAKKDIDKDYVNMFGKYNVPTVQKVQSETTYQKVIQESNYTIGNVLSEFANGTTLSEINVEAETGLTDDFGTLKPTLKIHKSDDSNFTVGSDLKNFIGYTANNYQTPLYFGQNLNRTGKSTNDFILPNATFNFDYDFKKVRSFNIALQTENVYNGFVYTSEDGETWTALAGSTSVYGFNGNITTRYLRIQLVSENILYCNIFSKITGVFYYFQNQFTLDLPEISSGQRIAIKTPVVDVEGATSNTLDGYLLDNILIGETSYELIWNGSSFDVKEKDNVILNINLSENVTQVDISNLLEENGVYIISVNGLLVEGNDVIKLRDNNYNQVSCGFVDYDYASKQICRSIGLIFINSGRIASIYNGNNSTNAASEGSNAVFNLKNLKICTNTNKNFKAGTNIQIRRLD